MTGEPLLALRDVGRHFVATAGARVRALEHVDLDVVRGEFVALAGPSGSGKSTLLHILGLLDTPTEGVYRLAGRDTRTLDDDARARERNRRVGFVFQAFHLIPELSVLENVALPLLYAGLEPRRREEAARAVLDRVGLSERVEHRPGELSGGEQQRVALARALVAEPELLLADEPTGNLDERTTEDVLARLREIHAGGTTIVLVTHNRRVASVAERRLELRGGQLSA
jgi:putative ABC transport system ATP-binding protein